MKVTVKKNAQHEIPTQGHQLINCNPCRVSQNEEEMIRNEIKRMKQMGVSEDLFNPWSSQIALAGKKDNGVRYCVDLEKVYAVTKKDAYLILKIDNYLAALNGANFF